MDNSIHNTSSWLLDSFSADELLYLKTTARLGAAIQLRRKELNISQKELAKLCGVTQRMVRKWESGECNFTVKDLAVISTALQ